MPARADHELQKLGAGRSLQPQVAGTGRGVGGMPRGHISDCRLHLRLLECFHGLPKADRGAHQVRSKTQGVREVSGRVF